MSWVYILFTVLIALWTVYCIVRHFKKKGSCCDCKNCSKNCAVRQYGKDNTSDKKD